MEEKKKILSKLNIKDYRNDLELVLENKQFDEEAKSLLLSIFYKFDNFYKDYMIVKKQTNTKNGYLENYINIIKNKCNTIKILKPKQIENNNKYIIDREKGEIQCLPNEIILLYAVYELSEKYISSNRYMLDDFTKICVNYVMNKGKTINLLEPIRDFNGWSWNPQIDNTNNIIYNLIYQNIIILLGNEFVSGNIIRSNIMELFEERLNAEEYQEFGEQFLLGLYEICIILYNNESCENHEKCLKYKKSLISKKQMLINRKADVKNTSKISSNISKQIKKIDNMLSDIKLLKMEYEKCIKQDRDSFFGLSDFVEKKENEKEKLLEHIRDNNKVLNQNQYLANHDNYESTLLLYEEIQDDKEKINLQTKLLKLQRNFLECLKIKIEKTELKKDLENLVSDLRYYCNVLCKKNKTIIQEEKLSKELEKILKKMIDKMINNKIIDTGFKSEKLNYNILKYIFKTRIIELRNLVIKISFKGISQIYVEYYDAKALEYKESFEIPFDEVIISKKDRKIKLL